MEISSGDYVFSVPLLEEWENYQKSLRQLWSDSNPWKSDDACWSGDNGSFLPLPFCLWSTVEEIVIQGAYAFLVGSVYCSASGLPERFTASSRYLSPRRVSSCMDRDIEEDKIENAVGRVLEKSLRNWPRRPALEALSGKQRCKIASHPANVKTRWREV